MRTEWEIENYTEKILVGDFSFPNCFQSRIKYIEAEGLQTLRWVMFRAEADCPPALRPLACPHRLHPLPQTEVSGAWEL